MMSYAWDAVTEEWGSQQEVFLDLFQAITEEEAQAKAHHTSRLNQHEDPTLENALYCKRLAVPDRAEIW